METVIIDKFTNDILSLPESYRAKLASLLIQSLDYSDQHSEAEVEAAWDEELLRRVKQIEEGAATGYPADEVFSEIKAQYK
ncbi:MAG: addiction module protein [Desulfobacterales bacterium]|nr:addiction module protein [Desulfobacterales bacterium]